MEFRGDERAVVIQIGAVLLLAALVIAMSGYQATVVPDQNNEIEFNHNQDVQGQMQELRNGVVSAPGGGSGASVRVDLGVRYPSRTFFVNPSPATGTLRTVGTTDGDVNITVDNARATGETSDYWTGTNRSFNTGALAYEPKYSEYDDAPTTIYEQSLLYNRFADANITISEQSMVDGRQINLVALNGSLSESGTDSTSVSVRPVSASRNAVAVEGDGGDPINITVPTRLDNATWRDALEEEYASNGGNIVGQSYDDVPGEAYALLTIELDGSKTYNLRMAKVGLGSDVTEESEDLYLTDVEGGGSVATDGTQRVTVEVRDRYNNPISGERVSLTVDGDGKLDNGTMTAQFVTGTSDSDGRVTVTYEAPGSEMEDTVTANIDATPTPSEKVEFKIDVAAGGGSGGGGSSGAYSVDWNDPDGDNPSGPLSSCSADSCTWDLGADGNGELDLRTSLSDSISGMTVEFGVNNSTVATVSPQSATTDSNGEVTATLNGAENGPVGIYAASGGSSDGITIKIVNASGGGGSTNSRPTADFTYSCTETECKFNSTSTDADGTIDRYEWDFNSDGTVDATGRNVTYTYSSAGTHDVTHTVTDNDSASASETKQVTVTGSIVVGTNVASSSGSKNKNSIVTVNIENRHAQNADVTAVTVNGTLNNKAVELDDGSLGTQGEVEFDIGDTGTVDAAADNANGYPFGTMMSLNSTTTLSGGQTAAITFNEFDSKNDGQVNPEEMVGSDVIVTVHYTHDGTGQTVTETVTV